MVRRTRTFPSRTPLRLRWRHAGQDHFVLPGNRPTGARDTGAIRPHDFGKPGADLRANPAPIGKSRRSQVRETSHRGRGSRSQLLNQLAADATGATVITGPVEATAIGNILIQALALGHLESAAHLRRIVENSFPTQTFLPGAGLSDAVRTRFQKLHLQKS